MGDVIGAEESAEKSSNTQAWRNDPSCILLIPEILLMREAMGSLDESALAASARERMPQQWGNDSVN